MTAPHFFGYGSLVNRATHDFPVRNPARVTGWRRSWRHRADRKTAFLTVIEHAGSTIDGLVASVPDNDWAALDVREAHYDRVPLGTDATPAARDIDLQVYRAKAEQIAPPDMRHPILLSYLDVVVQGYLTVFGDAGVADFFDTTDGWDAPVVDDRSDPIYARAQPTSPRERQITDHFLQASAAQVQQLHETPLARERRPFR